MKVIVNPDNAEALEELLKLNIDGIIIGINNLSINTNFSYNIKEIIELTKKTKKEIYININKIMHNEDILLLRDTLSQIVGTNIKVFFYDFSVLRIAKELGVVDQLIINQTHLNNSIMSNNFYYQEGIKNTCLSNDITLEEILDIKKNTSCAVYLYAYGYIPIFYSKRKLLTSYFTYTNQDKQDNQYHIVEGNQQYLIKEEPTGTAIYSNIIDLTEEYHCFNEHNIDAIILNQYNIDFNEFIKVLKDIENIKNNHPIRNIERYKAFLYNKTIYKVK